eukprot:3795921-Rhodomonas_salina.2
MAAAPLWYAAAPGWCATVLQSHTGVSVVRGRVHGVDTKPPTVRIDTHRYASIRIDTHRYASASPRRGGGANAAPHTVTHGASGSEADPRPCVGSSVRNSPQAQARAQAQASCISNSVSLQGAQIGDALASPGPKSSEAHGISLRPTVFPPAEQKHCEDDAGSELSLRHRLLRIANALPDSGKLLGHDQPAPALAFVDPEPLPCCGSPFSGSSHLLAPRFLRPGPSASA